MYSLDEETNEEEDQEKESQDYSTPFSPPEGVQDTIPKDYPELDTNMDSQEWYDEGRSGAAEVDDPGSRGVLGYTPAGSDDNDEDDDDDKKEEQTLGLSRQVPVVLFLGQIDNQQVKQSQ